MIVGVKAAALSATNKKDISIGTTAGSILPEAADLATFFNFGKCTGVGGDAGNATYKYERGSVEVRHGQMITASFDDGLMTTCMAISVPREVKVMAQDNDLGDFRELRRSGGLVSKLRVFNFANGQVQVTSTNDGYNLRLVKQQSGK